jgi:hypothetical protein
MEVVLNSAFNPAGRLSLATGSYPVRAKRRGAAVKAAETLLWSRRAEQSSGTLQPVQAGEFRDEIRKVIGHNLLRRKPIAGQSA